MSFGHSPIFDFGTFALQFHFLESVVYISILSLHISLSRSCILIALLFWLTFVRSFYHLRNRHGEHKPSIIPYAARQRKQPLLAIP
jgi:hypothetical protein